MSLFNEAKNKYILSTLSVINRIYNGEKMSVSELEKAIYDGVSDNTYFVGEGYIEKIKNEYMIFDFSKKEQVKPVIESCAAIRASRPEKIWLKTILKDERIKLFLDSDTINVLINNLNDIDDMDINENIYSKSWAVNKDILDENFKEKFLLLLKATTECRYISFTNNAMNGDIYYNKRELPYKIEYSVIDEKFRISLYSFASQRPIKVNIDRIQGIKLYEKADKMVYLSVDKMLERRKAKQPITVIIDYDKNAVERAALLFSQYNRKIRLRDDEKLEINIDYYIFDEIELIRNIMSLGPVAVVTKPKEIVDKIRSILFYEVNL